MSRSTDLNWSLSIASDEAATPAPTYGMPASSSRPCTVPSSPNGPCRTGKTTSTSGERCDDRAARQPLERRRGARAGSSCRAAPPPSAHAPPRPISIATTSIAARGERGGDAAAPRRPRPRARSSGRRRGPRPAGSRRVGVPAGVVVGVVVPWWSPVVVVPAVVVPDVVVVSVPCWWS